MNQQIKPFGSINTQDISVFTLKNNAGTSISVCNYGASIVSLLVPDQNSNLIDVVLGFDNLESYIKQDKYIGAIIGRNCNRIKNSVFNLNDTQYQLQQNDGKHNLHSAYHGLDKEIWNIKFCKGNIVCEYLSKEYSNSFPGNLNVKVTYSLTEDNNLLIDYYAVCDKDTVTNLTNHSYFNLNGHDSGTIENHQIEINANQFTPTDKTSIPTGEIQNVTGTPFDFTTPKTIHENINKSHPQLAYSNGFDHNYVVNNAIGKLKKVASVTGDLSKIKMNVFTTMPGMQFYTGNSLEGCPIGKMGANYGFRSGLCLETQYFPNSINTVGFAKPILKKGEIYRHQTIYSFIK